MFWVVHLFELVFVWSWLLVGRRREVHSIKHSSTRLHFFSVIFLDKKTFVPVSMGVCLRSSSLYELRIRNLPVNDSTIISSLPPTSSDGSSSLISFLHHGGVRADGAAACESVVGGVLRVYAGVDDDG